MSTELDDLIRFLEGQRRTVLATLDGLTDAQVVTPTPVSAMPLLGIVQHLSYVERRWIHMGADAQRLTGIYPPEPAREFDASTRPRDEVLATYEDVARESDRILRSFGSGDEPCRAAAMKRNVREVALHLIEETAAHAGHAAIIRESIDGRVGI